MTRLHEHTESFIRHSTPIWNLNNHHRFHHQQLNNQQLQQPYSEGYSETPQSVSISFITNFNDTPTKVNNPVSLPATTTTTTRNAPKSFRIINESMIPRSILFEVDEREDESPRKESQIGKENCNDMEMPLYSFASSTLVNYNRYRQNVELIESSPISVEFLRSKAVGSEWADCRDQDDLLRAKEVFRNLYEMSPYTTTSFEPRSAINTKSVRSNASIMNKMNISENAVSGVKDYLSNHTLKDITDTKHSTPSIMKVELLLNYDDINLVANSNIEDVEENGEEQDRENKSLPLNAEFKGICSTPTPTNNKNNTNNNNTPWMFSKVLELKQEPVEVSNALLIEMKKENLLDHSFNQSTNYASDHSRHFLVTLKFSQQNISKLQTLFVNSRNSPKLQSQSQSQKQQFDETSISSDESGETIHRLKKRKTVIIKKRKSCANIPKPKPKPKPKPSNSRSKSGCWTCRIRHKRCPEEKPACSQCERLHLQCDYSNSRPDYMLDASLHSAKLEDIKEQTSKVKKKNLRELCIKRKHQRSASRFAQTD